MQAVIRRGSALVCEQVNDPVPGRGQVLLRTLACGICGSDLHALQHGAHLAELGRRSGARTVLDPDRDLVFGHEFCGEIVDYGPGSNRRLKPGTRAVALPRITGPSGVETVGFSNRFPGGFGELVCVDETMLTPVPNGLADTHAAMTEPFAVGAHAVARARMDEDSVALVIGCGPVGLAVIAALKVRGVAPVIAADFSPARRRTAELMGADIVIDPALESPFSRWGDVGAARSTFERDVAQAAGRRIANAVIFECVGAPGVIQQIIEGACPAAQVVVVGVCMLEDRFEPYQALTKEISLTFSSAYTAPEFADTLSHIAEGRIDVAPVVTGVIGRSEVAGAFETLAAPDGQVKMVVEPWRD